MQRSEESFCPEGLLLGRRNHTEKNVRVQIQVPHLDHLHRQLAEKILPCGKLLLTVVEAGEIEEVQAVRKTWPDFFDTMKTLSMDLYF